jgi:hypothetical protein
VTALTAEIASLRKPLAKHDGKAEEEPKVESLIA